MSTNEELLGLCDAVIKKAEDGWGITQLEALCATKALRERLIKERAGFKLVQVDPLYQQSTDQPAAPKE